MNLVDPIHQNRSVGDKQLDDGIVDTLVSAGFVRGCDDTASDLACRGIKTRLEDQVLLDEHIDGYQRICWTLRSERSILNPTGVPLDFQVGVTP